MTLDLAILKVLADEEKAQPIVIIVYRAKERIGYEPTHTDSLLALRRLEKRGDVIGTNNVDLGIVWKATDDGRLRAA